MNRPRSTSERFMEPAKGSCQNRLLMDHASGADHALHSVESKPVKPERAGVVQEEYDRLLGRISEEISYGDVWLTFPEGGHDAVEITTSDMESVHPGGFVSGNVIDFYIKYLWEGLSCHMHKDHIHFFNSFFFTQLADTGGASTESEQRKTSFEKVQKWTGGVNIFDKAYVFIPVNQSYHWSLIIICHLSSLTSSPDKHECPPCILHLDSVEGKHGNLESHIRSYIIHAWKESYHDPSVEQLLALSQMKYAEVKVPQQDNHYDCGIYLLHFVELFLVESLGGFGSVPNQGILFSALWDASEVSAKRREIKNLILELSLASRRKSRQHQKLISRLLQLMPVSQISEVLETRLDSHGPQNNDPKQSKAGVDESKQADHQTTGEVALENQQHSEIDHVCNQKSGVIVLEDQQKQHKEVECDEVECVEVKCVEVECEEVECEEVECEEVECEEVECEEVECEEVECEEVECEEVECEDVECTELKPVKRRRKRRVWKWSKEETSVLLDCKKKVGGRFYKKRKMVRTDWIAISKEIENKVGTTPSGNQCRLRYASLLKAYKSAKDYCIRTGKQFSEELSKGELKTTTTLTEEWYDAIDVICRCSPQKDRSPKRVKLGPRVDGGGGGALVNGSPCIEKCAEARHGSQSAEEESVERVDFGNPESPTRDPCSQQRALEYLRAFLRSESQNG